jgi:hypothetical protein
LEQSTLSPGQDLSRLTQGPSAYLNGTPNVSSKATLTRTVQLSPRGKFSYGHCTGPGQATEMVMDRKLACKRSTVGPDPYGLWTLRSPRATSASPFAPEKGDARQPWVMGRTATQAFDRCA